MANHIFTLVVIMLFAGVLGGLINYYLYSQQDPDTASLPRCVLLGVGASFLVPLLLHFINVDLVIKSQEDPSKLFILASSCLVAAFVSRVFITTVSEQILKEASFAKAEVERLRHELRLLQEEVLPLIETETEQNSSPAIAETSSEDSLDVTCARVLKALASGRYIFRSVPGLCNEANMEEVTMDQTLTVLVNRHMAGKCSGRSGLRWFVTEKGRRVLESV